MKRFLKSALAVLPLVMLASCAADDIVVDDGIAKNSETRYLRVTLSSADGTPGSRSIDGLDAEDGNYEGGTTDENKINTLEFYFYDRFKNFHSYVSMNVKDAPTDPTQNTDASKPNLHGFYHCNVPVELVQGETFPQYVICIINSVEGSAYKDKSMAEAQTKILKSIYASNSGDTKYFGMSNSVYYGKDEVIGTDNELIMATPFKTEMLKTETELKKLEAEGKLEANAIDIYVERYAAKVNLDLSSTAVSDYTSGGDNEVSLHFNPTGWTVNAIERSFFFLKAFRKPSETSANADTPAGVGLDFASFADMNAILFSGWNNAAHHRCFWARTPGYYANDYPLVSDDVNRSDENQYQVDYNSYNDCTPVDGKKLYSKYVMETTMKKSRLTGEDMGDQYLPLSSIPSVLLVGKYSVNDQEGVDFYTYGKSGDKYVVYSGEVTEIEGTRKIKDKMLDDQTIILYYDNQKDAYIPVNSEYAENSNLRDIFEVGHPSEQVRMTGTGATESQENNGGIRVAADVVVLQIMQANENLYFYNSATQKYEKVTAEYLNTANRLLLQNLGGAHFYKEGMAFFSAPIQHWGWYRTEKDDPQKEANPNFGKPMDEWDWTKMETGDFGVVRNHIYTLNIGKIEGLGTGIKDPDEPIVPPADKVGYQVHFHVNIQKWAVLPTQQWDF